MHEIGRLAASEQIYGSPPESGPEQSAVPDEHEQELCPEVRYPRLYRQYTDALHKFTSTLPPRLRDPLRRIPGRNTPDIHAITLVNMVESYLRQTWKLTMLELLGIF